MANRDSAIAFTPYEEAFFRAGQSQSEGEASEPESFADLDEGYRRRPLLRRIFSRKSTQQ